MADPSTCPPLTPSSIAAAHKRIKPYIHRTPLLTCKTLDRIASSPTSEHSGVPAPKLRLFFKCENTQKIGAFKARGAYHAVLHLIEEMGIEHVRRRGVVTHSSGNHAQALALAASTFAIPAYIVMPTISTPSKIAGTKHYTDHVIFSGSTSQEREAKVAEVMKETGAILVPPYDHPDIILGQGTTALEMDEQYRKMAQSGSLVCSEAAGQMNGDTINAPSTERHLDAVLAPLGGGGLLGGIATYFSGSHDGSHDARKTLVFGCEPSFQGADDARRGIAATPPARITHVSTLTIADGLRTPVGVANWAIVSDASKVQAVYAVTEAQIRAAMRLVFERMKVVVEPSGCVALAVALYSEEWRRWVVERQGAEGGQRAWDVGIVFSGGNTTMEAVAALFGERDKGGDGGEKRAAGKVGTDGREVAEDVAG